MVLLVAKAAEISSLGLVHPKKEVMQHYRIVLVFLRAEALEYGRLSSNFEMKLMLKYTRFGIF